MKSVRGPTFACGATGQQLQDMASKCSAKKWASKAKDAGYPCKTVEAGGKRERNLSSLAGLIAQMALCLCLCTYAAARADRGFREGKLWLYKYRCRDGQTLRNKCRRLRRKAARRLRRVVRGMGARFRLQPCFVRKAGPYESER